MSSRVGKRWVHVKRPYIEAYILYSGGRRNPQGCVSGDIELIRVVRYPGNKSWCIQHKGVNGRTRYIKSKGAMVAAEDYLRSKP
jgi:hypothetical protein